MYGFDKFYVYNGFCNGVEYIHHLHDMLQMAECKSFFRNLFFISHYCNNFQQR